MIRLAAKLFENQRYGGGAHANDPLIRAEHRHLRRVREIAGLLLPLCPQALKSIPVAHRLRQPLTRRRIDHATNFRYAITPPGLCYRGGTEKAIVDFAAAAAFSVPTVRLARDTVRSLCSCGAAGKDDRCPERPSPPHAGFVGQLDRGPHDVDAETAAGQYFFIDPRVQIGEVLGELISWPSTAIERNVGLPPALTGSGKSLRSTERNHCTRASVVPGSRRSAPASPRAPR